MTYRMVHLHSVCFILYTLMSLLLIGMVFRIPYVFVPVLLGWVAGFLIGGAVTLRALSFLSKEGEYGVTLRWVAYMAVSVVGLTIVSAIASPYLSQHVTSETLILAWIFLNSDFAAMEATCAILYHRWEKKHGRHIVTDDFWSTRIHVFPRSDTTQNIGEH